jgi:hypothetical protein
MRSCCMCSGCKRCDSQVVPDHGVALLCHSHPLRPDHDGPEAVAWKAQGLSRGKKPVGILVDSGPEWGLEQVPIRGGRGIPAERAQIGREYAGVVGSELRDTANLRPSEPSRRAPRPKEPQPRRLGRHHPRMPSEAPSIRHRRSARPLPATVECGRAQRRHAVALASPSPVLCVFRRRFGTRLRCKRKPPMSRKISSKS